MALHGFGGSVSLMFVSSVFGASLAPGHLLTDLVAVEKYRGDRNGLGLPQAASPSPSDRPGLCVPCLVPLSMATALGGHIW